MTIRTVFGPDVRRAINATPARKAVSFGSMVALVALFLAFGSVAPWWLWLVVIVLEGIVFLVLGNRWAGKDALAREQRE